tara:strand:+ start:147 stop:815 length:669 start_codon:yes stop_codon:yes gene_type:complete
MTILKHDSILFVTDSDSSYSKIEDMIRALDFSFNVIKSSEIKFANQKYDILVLDRCASIISLDFYSRFKLAINTHPSLLPLHRGNFPIFWGSIFGDPHGITIHKVEKDVDTGDRIYQERIEYNEDMNFIDLYEMSRESICRGLGIVLQNYQTGNLESFTTKARNCHHHLNSYSKQLFNLLPSGWSTSIKEARRILHVEIIEYKKDIEWQQNRERLIDDIIAV